MKIVNISCKTEIKTSMLIKNDSNVFFTFQQLTSFVSRGTLQTFKKRFVNEHPDLEQQIVVHTVFSNVGFEPTMLFAVDRATKILRYQSNNSHDR